MRNLCGGLMLSDIVPRSNIACYLVHSGDGKNMRLLKEPLPPLPDWCGNDVPVTFTKDTTTINLEELFIELKLQTVTVDEMYRICEVLLRKEEANNGSIFRE